MIYRLAKERVTYTRWLTCRRTTDGSKTSEKAVMTIVVVCGVSIGQC